MNKYTNQYVAKQTKHIFNNAKHIFLRTLVTSQHKVNCKASVEVYQLIPPIFILLRLAYIPSKFPHHDSNLNVGLISFLLVIQSFKASRGIVPLYELMVSIWTGVFTGFIGAANARKGYSKSTVLMSSYHSSTPPG